MNFFREQPQASPATGDGSSDINHRNDPTGETVQFPEVSYIATARQIVSVETSTPTTRLFIEALLGLFRIGRDRLFADLARVAAIVDRAELAELTSPMSEPFPDVIQDLWQLRHLTTSYLARALSGGILLATGIVNDNAVAIVVAALFLPFLAEVLAVSCGLWSPDRHLILRGLRAIAASTILAFLAGLIVASFTGGPIRYQGFKRALASLALSAVIGVNGRACRTPTTRGDGT